MSISGFDFCRLDRSNPKKGGGVGFYYISNSLAWQQVTNIETDFELIVIKIFPKLASPFIIISLYRQPDLKASLLLSSFHYIFDHISSYPIDYYILGDLNIDLLHLHTKLGSELLSFMESYQTVQLIHEATRVTALTESLIDHIYTTCPEHVSKSGVVPIGISVNYLTYVVHRNSKAIDKQTTNSIIQFRSYEHFNEDLFLQGLALIPFHFLNSSTSPDDYRNGLMSLVLPIIDKHAPVQVRRIKQSSLPWMIDYILDLINQKSH